MKECMMYSDVTQFLVVFTGISLGAFLGIAGNKLVSSNYIPGIKWIFYLLAVTSIIIGGIFSVVFFKYLEILGKISIITLIVTGVALFIFTYRFLDVKYIFKTKELTPIINNWSSNADRSEIKLFGGDLSFFGNSFSEMNQDQQYVYLRDARFRKILILCEEPKTSETKRRYGKILDELKGTDLRFYEPDKADLQIRGRLKTVNGVSKLLVFLKIGSGRYQTIDTDTANSNGALYNNIWNLTWSLAKAPTDVEKDEYIQAFKA